MCDIKVDAASNRSARRFRHCAGFVLTILLTLTAIHCDTSAPGAQHGSSNVKTIFGEAGHSPGQFAYPRAIAVSPVDARVFIVDKRARVQRFTPDGTYELEWRMPEYDNGKPTGLYVDQKNRVFVADTHYARVICYDRDGKELFRFGSRGEGPGQFIFTECICVDSDGFIFVGEYGGNDRISKFTQDGQYLFSFADKNSGEGWTDRPTEILIDETGVLWVADSCNHRINRYSHDGKYLSSFKLGGDDPTTLCYPYGMAMEKSGNLIVADRGTSRIFRVTREGKVLGTWGGAGRNAGQLLQPWGVGLDRDGRIYCLDSWNNRVQVIEW